LKQVTYLLFFMLLFSSCKELNGLLNGAIPTSPNRPIVIPEKLGLVNDFANVLSHEEEVILRDMINRHNKRHKNELVLVTMDRSEPYKELMKSFWNAESWFEYKASVVYNANGKTIGVRRGIPLLGLLTDEEVQNVFNEMQPFLSSDEHFTGFRRGLKVLMKEIE